MERFELRSDLTENQKEHIRDVAKSTLLADVASDSGYLREIIGDYLSDKNLLFLLDTISTDSDMYEELLGFYPLVDQEE